MPSARSCGIRSQTARRKICRFIGTFGGPAPTMKSSHLVKKKISFQIDQIDDLKDVAKENRRRNPNLYYHKKDQINGIAVPYPYEFLKDSLGERQEIDLKLMVAPEHIFL
jgi:hypothetical protein